MAKTTTAKPQKASKRTAAVSTPSPSARVRWTKSHQLVGVVLILSPQKDISLTNKIATALHGWFLEQVAITDKALSAQLHDSQAEKAFVLSRVMGAAERTDDSLFLQVGQSYHLEIFGLSKSVCNWLKAWVKRLPDAIALRRGMQLPIAGWAVAQAPMTYAKLLSNAVEKVSRIEDAKSQKVTFSFVSPTSFRSKGNHVPLPIPKNLFHSYLRRWNAFASKSIDEAAFLDWVERYVTISHYDLHTRRTAVAKAGLVTGFVGGLTLSLSAKGLMNTSYAAYFYALVELAQYCGTGHKTPFGLGQTRLGSREEMPVVSAAAVSVSEEVVDVAIAKEAQQYTQVAMRVDELKAQFMSNRQQGGDRAARKAATMATILARQEAGHSLRDIAQDLRLSYETVKSYGKWARKELETGEVRQK